MDFDEVGVTYCGMLEQKGDMRWQQRYFELHGDTLFYFNAKGEKPRGELQLSTTSTVAALSGDPLGFQVIKRESSNNSMRLFIPLPLTNRSFLPVARR